MDLYRQAGGTAPTSLNMHGFVADTRAEAADTYYPAHSGVMNRIGRERGWGPTTGPRSTPPPGSTVPTSSAIPTPSPRRSCTCTTSSATTGC